MHQGVTRDGANRDPAAHPGEPALELRGIVKSYGATQALKGVDCCVRKGSVHALLGKNGAGKSTLLKVAVGATTPDRGSILIDGRELRGSGTEGARRSGLGMVFQDLSVLPNLSVSENVFLADERRGRSGLIAARRQRRETVELYAQLGLTVDPDAQVGSLGAGDQQMVEIVKALRLARSVLILDEPTAALSEAEVERLFAAVRRIAASGVGIAYVSHRLTEAVELCDEVTILRDGEVTLKAPMDKCDLETIVAEMVGEAGVPEAAERTHRAPAGGSAAPLLSVRGLEVRPKLEQVSFEVREGEIVGVAGLVGSGRSTLLKTLFGAIKPTAGSISLRGEDYAPRTPAAAIRAGVYLIPEKRHAEGLVLEHSIEANLSLSILNLLHRFGLYASRDSRERAEALIDGLAIRSTGPAQPVQHLSGGNQQKVVLGKAFNAASAVLLLDEPTYGVDIHASTEIRDRVRAFAGEGNGVIWVTSDVNELLAVSDRFLILADRTIRASIYSGPEVDESSLTHAIQPGQRHSRPAAA